MPKEPAGLERAVAEETLRVLEPGAIETALAAERAVAAGKDEHLGPVELELEQAPTPRQLGRR